VGRNSARGAATKNLDLTLTWGASIGQRKTDTRPGAPARPGAGAPGRPPQGRPGNVQSSRNNDLFRFEIYARASNVLNLVNPQNFSGVQTSPFFGLPTSASAARRIVVGSRVWF
jgi:hypothetical protein